MNDPRFPDRSSIAMTRATFAALPAAIRRDAGRPEVLLGGVWRVVKFTD